MTDSYEQSSFFRIWGFHLLIGVPLAAFCHSLVQFAASLNVHNMDRLSSVFPLHFLLGCLIGAVILVPAFTLQFLAFHFVVKICRNRPLIIGISGGLQALLVGLWILTVGIEPSLEGNFQLAVPMIVAGFVAGSAVAKITLNKFSIIVTV